MLFIRVWALHRSSAMWRRKLLRDDPALIIVLFFLAFYCKILSS